MNAEEAFAYMEANSLTLQTSKAYSEHERWVCWGRGGRNVQFGATAMEAIVAHKTVHDKEVAELFG